VPSAPERSVRSFAISLLGGAAEGREIPFIVAIFVIVCQSLSSDCASSLSSALASKFISNTSFLRFVSVYAEVGAGDRKENMEILIVSDSHGRKDNIRKVLLSHPDTKYLFFLGDGLGDVGSVIAEFPRVIAVAVRGNCDWLSDVPEERYFTVEGVRILMMHGHAYGVKGGLGAALSYAKSKEAHILLYGHTHVPHSEYVPDARVTLFNPGSIAERSSEGYSYGVLEIKEGEYLLSHGTIK